MTQLDRDALLDRIEAVIQEDTGRGIFALFAAARGGFAAAVKALADAGGPVGIITGFYVPGGRPQSAETDGPVGAALLALGLRRIGMECRLCTDAFCANATRAALDAAGLADVPVDVVSATVPTAEIVATWRASGVRVAIAIERCGRTRDGTARNMRGHDVGAWTVLLDDLFLAGPWSKIAIGDGGNELGMGALPPGLIATHVAHGESIACVTPCDHLIVTGVSHWGAYALLGGLALMRPEWREGLLACLDPGLDLAILTATMRDGPAVDGVTGGMDMTIDGISFATHHRVLGSIVALVDPAARVTRTGTDL